MHTQTRFISKHLRLAYNVAMSKSHYSDENLIVIECQLFNQVCGQWPDRGELAQITNRMRFNSSENKHANLQSVRSYFYRQQGRWPSSTEYANLLSQLLNQT